MCTSIIEIAPAEGMAKRGDEWFQLSQAVCRVWDLALSGPCLHRQINNTRRPKLSCGIRG
jgi:hypothetical protein